MKDYLNILITAKQTKEAVKMIASQLGLPIDINIVNVSSEYNVPNNYNEQTAGTQFHSRDLTEVDNDNKSSQGIIAQVLLPPDLPLYGASKLVDYPITVKISENSMDHAPSFAMIVAHELSHVLLHSLMHKEKNNEFYTDITAMISGFNSLFQKGRLFTKTEHKYDYTGTTTEVTTSTTYGYLSDNNFSYAHKKINSILEEKIQIKNEFMDKITTLEILLSKYEKIYSKFRIYLDYISHDHNKKITEKDGKRIVLFYKPGYFEDLRSALDDLKMKINKYINYHDNLSHYTNLTETALNNFSKELDNIINKFQGEFQSLKQNMKMIRKYVHLSFKLKLFFKSDTVLIKR